MINKNFCKNEKGSVTLFVLICMMFFCLILLGIYLASINKNNSQLKELENIKEEYISQESIDEIYYNQVKYVAQINSVKYRTLSEAIEAVKTDETILMIDDTTENNTVPEDKKFTLDLGEQTITGGIVNNGNIVITGNGTITSKTENILENNGNLTIYEGNFLKTDGEKTRVIKNYGTATINGGTFCKTYLGWSVENSGTLYFNDGKIILDYVDYGNGTALYNSSGTIEMNGGEITSNAFSLCIDGGSFKSTGGSISTNNGNTSVLVRNTGSAYLYNTFVTAISSTGGKLTNQTGKYNNLMYIYTKDMENSLDNVEGYNAGKVFMAEFSNNGNVHVTYFNSGYNTGNLAIWTAKDSQDDLEWITPYLVQNQDLCFLFNKSNHKGENGIYRLHLYTNGTSTFIEAIDIDVP